MNRTAGFIALFVFILGLVFPVKASAQVKPFSRWSEYIISDAGHLLRLFSDKDIYLGSWYLRGISVISSQDKAWAHAAGKWNGGGFADYLKIANEFGDANRVSRFSYGILALSLLTGNERFQDAAFTSIESQLISKGIVDIMKSMFGRARPYAHEGSHSFKAFSGRDSFPSKHTVIAFSAISAWIFYYPSSYTYALFLLPATTGLARMALDAHWATDVMASALIGTAVSYYLTKWHNRQSTERRFSIAVDQSSLRLVFFPSWLN